MWTWMSYLVYGFSIYMIFLTTLRQKYRPYYSRFFQHLFSIWRLKHKYEHDFYDDIKCRIHDIDKGIRLKQGNLVCYNKNICVHCASFYWIFISWLDVNLLRFFIITLLIRNHLIHFIKIIEVINIHQFLCIEYVN
jgi:hypothetical protein